MAPRKPDRAAEIQQASDLLLSFQSRTAKDVFVRDIEGELPRVVYEVGEPVRTNYWSDKDDPETRAPHKRKNDPDGVQGVYKDFTHRHDGGMGLRFYVPLSECGHFLSRGTPPQTAYDMEWPSVLTFLSYLTAVQIKTPGGVSTWEPPCKTRNGVRADALMLWAFPDSKTLVAMPDPRRNTLTGRVYVWHGGALHVTYRGIQG